MYVRAFKVETKGIGKNKTAFWLLGYFFSAEARKLSTYFLRQDVNQNSRLVEDKRFYTDYSGNKQFNGIFYLIVMTRV